MTFTNLPAFSRDLTRFASKLVPADLVKAHKKITLDVLSGTVKKTPVKTGRARGSWQVTVGAPPEGDVDTPDKNGNATIARGRAVLAVLPPFSVTWVASNLVYITALEDGHSTKAPHGMLALTLEEVRQSFA